MNSMRRIRQVLVACGLLLVLWGLWLGWSAITGPDRLHVVVWFALGVVIHDGVLAPTSVLLGRFALPHLPASARWGARALLAWVAAVLIIALPIVRQDRRPANPTIEFGHPALGVVVAVVAGVVVVAVVQTATAMRRRESAGVKSAGVS
jgi:hypothetical protein